MIGIFRKNNYGIYLKHKKWYSKNRLYKKLENY